MCDLESIDSSSILRLIRNVPTFVRILYSRVLDLSCEKRHNGSGWFPEGELLNQSEIGRFLNEPATIKCGKAHSGVGQRC